MKIEKSIVINRGSGFVYDYLRFTINQNNFSVWIFDSPSKFPMSLFSPIFKRMLGKDLEKSLTNLKSILEKE